MYFVVLLSAVVVCAAGVPLNSTQPKPEGRILNGQKVDIIHFPYQLSLWENERFRCGAVIISKQWALTAAHCVFGKDTSTLRVRARANNNQFCPRDMYTLETVIPHELYNYTKLQIGNDTSDVVINDIALLKVKSAFQLGRNVNSIPLATSTVTVGTKATVTGFGEFDATHQVSLILRKAVLEVVPRNECIFPGTDDINLLDKTICTKSSGSKPTGLCSGDSGGPLVTADGKLIGIASVTFGGCSIGVTAGIFTEVNAMRAWIINLTHISNK